MFLLQDKLEIYHRTHTHADCREERERGRMFERNRRAAVTVTLRWRISETLRS